MVVKGIIREFGENPEYKDRSGELRKIKGKYISLGTDRYSEHEMYFHFPADSSELYEFKVGDKLEIEGDLYGRCFDHLVFIHCTIFG